MINNDVYKTLCHIRESFLKIYDSESDYDRGYFDALCDTCDYFNTKTNRVTEEVGGV